MSQISSLDDVWAWLVSAFRVPRGLMVVAHNRAHPPRPEVSLELYEFEACPFCRKVREVMTELDLSYVSRTCAKGAGANRREVEARGGKRLFPYLVDPNTGTELYESDAIVDYLDRTYGSSG